MEWRVAYGGMRRWVMEWTWLSGPCPLPIGMAVSMPRCVYRVAWRVASTTDNPISGYIEVMQLERGERKTLTIQPSTQRAHQRSRKRTPRTMRTR